MGWTFPISSEYVLECCLNHPHLQLCIQAKSVGCGFAIPLNLWGHFLAQSLRGALKALDTYNGNCQRPVFSLVDELVYFWSLISWL